MYENDQIIALDADRWEVTLPYQGRAVVSLVFDDHYGTTMYRCDCNRLYCRHIMAVRQHNRRVAVA